MDDYAGPGVPDFGVIPSKPTTEAPVYRMVIDLNTNSATPLYYIVCDEGWAEFIVCQSMYEWSADWLLKILGRRPFAKHHQ